MKTALQIDITFDQILSLVKQLPIQQKIELTKELEKDGIDTKLSALLKTFQAKELSLDTINEEVEIVRQRLYTTKNIKVIFNTNVWISFLIGKRLSVIKNYISNGQITIVVAGQLLKEIEEVTGRERLKKYFPKENVIDLLTYWKPLPKSLK